VLVNANVAGERLTGRELASFFVLLLVAGNETTRNAISNGLIALTANPEQRAVWAADFDRLAPSAVEEIVRWATPLMWMRRTATRDTALGGQPLRAGDNLLLLYASANRDDAAFDEPYRFDLTRTPNPHLSFGAPGPQFCLGAHLARREITATFSELLRRVPDPEVCGESERLRSKLRQRGQAPSLLLYSGAEARRFVRPPGALIPPVSVELCCP
jgi:cytochrome P450